MLEVIAAAMAQTFEAKTIDNRKDSTVWLQQLSFKPSLQASGWLLQDNSGTALAFIPTNSNATKNHSALF